MMYEMYCFFFYLLLCFMLVNTDHTQEGVEGRREGLRGGGRGFRGGGRGLRGGGRGLNVVAR